MKTLDLACEEKCKTLLKNHCRGLSRLSTIYYHSIKETNHIKNSSLKRILRNTKTLSIIKVEKENPFYFTRDNSN